MLRESQVAHAPDDSLREVVSYLLGHGLLTRRHLVRGRVEVVDASRRNRNTAVLVENGPSWFVKRSVDTRAGDAIAREAVGYDFVRALARRELLTVLPRVGRWDPDRGWLTLEAFPRSRSLREHYARCGRLPAHALRRLGTALAALHRLPGPTFASRSPTAGEPPWILSLHNPSLDLLREASAANLELIALVQGELDFARHLDELAREWTSEALVHGDLRWDNCLIWPGQSRHSRLRIADWELAGAGDPTWDVGAVLGDALDVWVTSIPIVGPLPDDLLTDLARHPLDSMRSGLRAFWEAYIDRSRLAPAAALHRLLKSARFAGTRLVQATFERMEASPVLTGAAAHALQLALNVMRRPGEAATTLFGLTAEGHGCGRAQNRTYARGGNGWRTTGRRSPAR